MIVRFGFNLVAVLWNVESLIDLLNEKVPFRPRFYVSLCRDAV